MQCKMLMQDIEYLESMCLYIELPVVECWEPFYMSCKLTALGTEYSGNISIAWNIPCMRWDAVRNIDMRRFKFPESSKRYKFRNITKLS